MFWLRVIQTPLTFITGNVSCKGGSGGLPPSKRVRCVSEISFAMGEAQFTISNNDYFTASCILATGETLVYINRL